jgi:hypothetical protein
MNIRDMLHRVMDDWIRGIVIGVVAGVIATLAATGIISYVKSKRDGEVVKPRQTVEVVTMTDLDKAIDEAKTSIEASGYVVAKITPDLVNGKMLDSPIFSANIVMVNPLGKAICLRQHDEDDQPRTYGEILSKTQNFIRKSKDALGKRLKLGFIDAYPTMTVIIVDSDLYAYFYPYKAMGRKSKLGPDSPVVKFIDYANNKQAEFFKNHLNNIIDKAEYLTTEADYQKYLTASQRDPCFSGR